jgi:hypothetical protein
MGNRQKEEVTKTGKLTGTVKNCEGGIQGNITLSDVIFLSNGQYKLISITKVMQSVWKLEGNENMITSTVNDKTTPKKVEINKSHALFGHILIKMTQNISNTIGWNRWVKQSDASIVKFRGDSK